MTNLTDEHCTEKHLGTKDGHLTSFPFGDVSWLEAAAAEAEAEAEAEAGAGATAAVAGAGTGAVTSWGTSGGRWTVAAVTETWRVSPASVPPESIGHPS